MQEYRPVPARMGGDTPNPGALETSLSSVALPALAAFSILRGLGEALTPPRGHVADRGRARWIGLGEVAIGVGLLAAQQKRHCLLARAGLDALEGFDRARGGGGPISVGRRVASVLVDLYAANKLAPAAEAREALVAKTDRIARSVTINRPVDEVFRLARTLGTIPQCWAPVAEVEDVDERTARFRMQGLTFDVTIENEIPGERVDWRAQGMGLTMPGGMTFRPAPGDRGTEATLHMELPEAWKRVGAPVLTALRMAPSLIVYNALVRFGALAETGRTPSHQPRPVRA